MNIKGIFLAIALVVCAVSASTLRAEGLSEDQKINLLIQSVRESGLVFVRNGSEHASADAADHMLRKRNATKDKVKTAKDFIDYVASKSSMTGKPYYIKEKDGKLVTAKVWLTAKLISIEARK